MSGYRGRHRGIEAADEYLFADGLLAAVAVLGRHYIGRHLTRMGVAS